MTHTTSPDLLAGRSSELDRRFRQVMDSAPVMIWVSGPHKGCVWFNRPWLTFTGRRMVQELGEGWTEGVHRVVCFPEPVPGVRSESGYFRSLERRCGDGTE